MTFPSPIGGVPFPEDYAPSILFAVLYALLAPLIFYRMLHKRSRNFLLVGSMIFAIERVVIFALRAGQAHNEAKRGSKGLASYVQWSFGMGFIGISQDLVSLLRCLLVNASHGSDNNPMAPVPMIPQGSASTSTYEFKKPLGDGNLSSPADHIPDQPRQRAWARAFAGYISLAFLAATVPGIIAALDYKSAMTDQKKADNVMHLRYASCAVALLLIYIIAMVVLWAHRKLPRVNRKATTILMSLAVLMGVTAIYRLSVMGNTTTSLTSTAPGSLNTTGPRVTFYLFHMLPEWIAIAVLFGFNVRETFVTGLLGDIRWRDETPEEKQKREAKMNKKAARNAV